MGWIKNAKKEKPEILTDETRFSKSVLIHLKIGLTFIGCYDYEEECWWSENTRIGDSEVMFWCNIPKLPKKMCKKKKYKTKLDAMLVLARCNLNKRLETRIYFCKECNAYHLTKWKKWQNFEFK